ncbi:hypothetical protein ABBQ38_003040 [Trebouxia sp. C0009 RCD-2024]
MATCQPKRLLPRFYSNFQQTDKTLPKRLTPNLSQRAKGGQTRAILLHRLWTARYCAGCATATSCTENKALLIAQPLPRSEESLCKQQSCVRIAAWLQDLDTALFELSCFAINLGASQGIASYLICA